jgi:hypothetical protein
MFATIVTLVIGGATLASPSMRAPITGLRSADAVARNRSAGCPDRASTPISVAVTAPSGLSESLLQRVFAEAEAIWEPVGIAFDWHMASTQTRGWQLAVTIENPHDQLTEWQPRLGWILFAAGTPDCRIHLSQANAEALVRRTPGAVDVTSGTHERLIGRALGRAFSHELGHYLLQSKGHSPQGLMRAIWPSTQLLSDDRGGFELAPDQQETVTRRLQHMPLTCDQPL